MGKAKDTSIFKVVIVIIYTNTNKNMENKPAVLMQVGSFMKYTLF